MARIIGGKMMAGLWSSFSSKKTRERFAWLGAGISTIIAASWTVFVYFNPPKKTDEVNRAMVSDSIASEVQNKVNQEQGGYGNIQAGPGATVSVGKESERPATDTLEIVDVRWIREAQLDVNVMNYGIAQALIHHISITKVDDKHICALPILRPTAKYKLPVDNIKVGDTATIPVSQVVGARSADRFLIATNTTCSYTLKLTLEYNKSQSVSYMIH
jgi:hypothetical protein